MIIIGYHYLGQLQLNKRVTQTHQLLFPLHPFYECARRPSHPLGGQFPTDWRGIAEAHFLELALSRSRWEDFSPCACEAFVSASLGSKAGKEGPLSLCPLIVTSFDLFGFNKKQTAKFISDEQATNSIKRRPTN